jgi:Carboxypeptidase regulatory-like domain
LTGFASKHLATSVLVAGLLAISVHANAGDLSFPVTGNVLGTVENASGVPQMGATVQLFNKFERLIAKTMTGSDGRFAFASLPADYYSVRVSLASYLPVARNRIAVKPGVDSLLEVHVASLLSNMEVTYAIPTAAMTNDWKWALRSSPATRPITRFLPGEVSSSQNSTPFPKIFSETHAMFSLSGGDSRLVDMDSGLGDMGTGFIVSTNILGKNLLQLGGNYAQSTTSGPSSIGLVAIYSRDPSGGPQESPELTLTVSQLGLVGGPPLSGSNGASAASLAVRSMALSIYQSTDPVDNVHLEYGMTGESVDYVQHSSRISPFARLSVSGGNAGKIIAAYSDGSRPDALSAHQQRQGVLQQDKRGDDLAAAADSLGRVPQLSYSNQRMVLQRTSSYEVGYQKVTGSRTYSVSMFYEDVSHGRANVAGAAGVLDSGNLLSDGVSKTLIYDIGRYKRSGAFASVSQNLGEFMDASVAVGRMGGFNTNPNFGNDPQAALLDQRMRTVANAGVDAKIPRCGTKLVANYSWTSGGAFVPSHVFTTQNVDLAPGLNILVRQPLPSMFGMPGHLEITADLRNLLAQGYMPVPAAAAGHNLLVVQAPRGLRGGVNFIF